MDTHYQKSFHKDECRGLKLCPVKKPDKIALWSDLEELLPPHASDKPGRDPVGLVSLVDRAYSRAYKLHKAYSSAMRFHCAARWLAAAEQTLAQSEEEPGWKTTLISLARSEPGSYRLERDKITLVSAAEGTRIDSCDRRPTGASRAESVTGVLFG